MTDERLRLSIKRNRQLIALALVMVLLGLSGVSALMSYQLSELAHKMAAVGLGGLMQFTAMLILIKAIGMSERGYCRTFSDWLLPGEYSDPPLDEWEESLERQNTLTKIKDD